MNLYEIDNAILDCLDLETGEIIDVERLNELQMVREKKIEGVALWVKNLKADVAAYKAEKDAFAEREKQAKAKVERLSQWLTMALDGHKMTTDRVVINFRKSEAIEIEDEGKFIDWAEHYRDDLLTYKSPTPNKTAIKAAMKDGSFDNLGGAIIVLKNNIQIK